jgi:hypothetical protein
MNIAKLLASLDKRIDICKSGQADAESLTIAHSLMLMREVISEAEQDSCDEMHAPAPPIYSPAVRETATAIARDLLMTSTSAQVETLRVGNTGLELDETLLEERLLKHLGALEERLMRGP